MKIICSLNNWSIKTPSTARNLILACSENGLFPNYLKAQLTSVRSLLESGVPTLRNKNAAHGQGNAVINVPGSLAKYTLNLTATSILFLVDAHESLQS